MYAIENNSYGSEVRTPGVIRGFESKENEMVVK